MKEDRQRAELAGYRVLVGRTRSGASSIASQLRAYGAEVLEAPEVEVVELSDWMELDQVLHKADRYQAMIFACAASVDVVIPRLRELGCECSVPIVAIGEQADGALHRLGVEAEVVTKGACRQELLACLSHLADADSLLFSSVDGRPQLKQDLHTLGMRVRAVAAYRYLYHFVERIPCDLDLVIIPGSSAASVLLKSEWGPVLRGVPMVAMGESSARGARLYGAGMVVQAEQDTVDSIVTCAVEQLMRGKGMEEFAWKR